MKKILYTLLLFLPTHALSAPSITDVAWHGSIITITGSEFGSKSPAAPLLWDNFEDGADGESLSTNDNWAAYVGSGGEYDDETPYSGELAAYNYADNDYGEFETSYHVLSSPTDEIYYTYRFRHVGSGNYRDQVEKGFRVNTGTNRYSGDGMVALSDGYVFYRPDNTSVYPEDPDEENGRSFTTSDYGASSWVRWQLYGKYSTPAGTANGIYQVSVGDMTKTFSSRVNRASGYSFQYTSALLGLMHANLEAGDYHHMWIDDVYIDNTMARVELCDSETWTNGSDCNPQPATVWGSDSITVSANVSSFGVGSTAYLFVIDSAGSVSPAYEVTVGTSSATPSILGIPTIQGVTIR